MRTRTVAVLVAALVVLAGCAGSAGEQATATANAETATVETTTTAVDTTDAETADLPPGVNESGVEDAAELVAAHGTALSESGYAFVFRLRSNGSSGDEFGSRLVVRGTVAKNFAPFRIRTDLADRRDDRTVRLETDVWANESVALVQSRLRNRTAYRQYDATLNETPERDSVSPVQTINVADQASMSSVVRSALMIGRYEVADVETRNGLTFTTLRATDYNWSLPELDPRNVSQFESTLVVDERGRVHGFNATLVTNGSLIRYEFELTNVGGVVVPYPGWADEALATVNAAIRVGTDVSGNYFVFSHEGGERLPPGSAVRVSHAGANYTLELTEPLRPGEEVYVYFPAEGGTPVLAREPPAEDETAPLRGGYEFRVVDPTGNALLNAAIGFGTATEPTTAASETTTITAPSETTDTANASETTTTAGTVTKTTASAGE